MNPVVINDIVMSSIHTPFDNLLSKPSLVQLGFEIGTIKLHNISNHHAAVDVKGVYCDDFEKEMKTERLKKEKDRWKEKGMSMKK